MILSKCLSSGSSNFLKTYNLISLNLGALFLNSSNGGMTPLVSLKFRFFLMQKFSFSLKLIKRSFTLFLFSNIVVENTLKNLQNILVSTNNFFIFFNNLDILFRNFFQLILLLNQYGVEVLCIWYYKKLYSLNLFCTIIRSLKGVYFFSFFFFLFI